MAQPSIPALIRTFSPLSRARSSVLDYLSDFVCCLYGVPPVSLCSHNALSVREGINIFLTVSFPLKIRVSWRILTFRMMERSRNARSRYYKRWISRNEQILWRGESSNLTLNPVNSQTLKYCRWWNGTGKTTLSACYAGIERPDTEDVELSPWTFPQTTKTFGKTEQTVRDVFPRKDSWHNAALQFQTDVIKPLMIGRHYRSTNL